MFALLSRIAASPSKTLLACTSAYLGATFVHSRFEHAWLSNDIWAGMIAVVGIGLLGGKSRTASGIDLSKRHAERESVPFTPLSIPETTRPFPSRNASVRLLLLLIMVTLSALWRFESKLPDPSPLPPGTEHRGTVVREPVRDDSRFRLTVGGVRADGRDLGTMFVTSRDLFHVREGDDVAWRCRPTRPDADAIFCDADGPVRVTGHDFHPLLALRARLRSAVRSSLPEPEASLQLGLLVGDRGGLPETLIEDFRDTGTTHVLAVSGYNVALVAEALVTLFALAGLARRHAAIGIILCVFAFAGLAGADPPVTRAALMGSVALLAAALGRRPHAANGLLLAAAFMLAVDPMALRHDIGFRLSFAAVMGLSAFGRAFAERMTFIPIDGIRNALGETLGATVATIPIMLHDFGSLAFASPMTNVMIAPLVPFSTAVGAVAAVLSMLFPPLGLLPASVSGASLRLMRAIVSWWAEVLPATELQVGTFAAFALYVPIGFLWLALRKKEKA